MGKYKPKCQCPLHQGKSGSVFAIAKPVLEQAKEKFPVFGWGGVKNICYKCKKLVLDSQPQKKIRKRGRKNKATTSSAAAETDRHTTALPTTENGGSQTSSSSTSTVRRSPRVEAGDDDDTGMEFEVEEGPAIVIASQSSAQTPNISQSTATDSETGSMLAQDFLLEELNLQLQRMHISPLTKSSFYHPNEVRATWSRAIANITASFSKLIQGRYELQPDQDKECEYCDELFISLCGRHRTAKTKDEKSHILTSLPGKFTATAIAQEAGIKYCTALNAMNLRQEMGVFSARAPKVGKKITDEVVAQVLDWYKDPENSRASPLMNITLIGPRDSVLGPLHMLHNQTDAYALFKAAHPDSKIGKTKFIELAPKEIVWPKHRPFHNFCVCTVCSNFDFIYRAFGNAVDMKTFVSSILCDPVREDCAYGLCNQCPTMNDVYVLLELLQDEQVTYKQWVRTDGTELRTIIATKDDFSNLFLRSLNEYIKHDFIKKKQRAFIKYLKDDKLKQERALLILVDFAQNYNVIVQNAVQGHHWSNRQVTVHPFVVTWFDPIMQAYKEKSYVVISDEMCHDASTFNTFKRKVVSHIKVDFEDFAPTHFYYISDNCAGQYKCYKGFAHLMKHEEEFGISAEWVFTAPGHGKGNADRISAVVKSTTKRHALKADNYILTAKEMYDFCVGKLGNEKIKFHYITKEEVSAERGLFEQLYATTRRLRGTQSYFHFVPQDHGNIMMAKVAGSANYDTFNIMRDFTLLIDPDAIDAGDLMCFVETHMIQVGMFIEKDDEYAEFQAMKIARTNFNLRWPHIPVFVKVPLTDILMKVSDPVPEPAGRFFTYSEDQISEMRDKMELWNEMRH